MNDKSQKWLVFLYSGFKESIYLMNMIVVNKWFTNDFKHEK